MYKKSRAQKIASINCREQILATFATFSARDIFQLEDSRLFMLATFNFSPKIFANDCQFFSRKLANIFLAARVGNKASPFANGEPFWGNGEPKLLILYKMANPLFPRT